MTERLQLVIVHDSNKNEYRVSTHNITPDEALKFVEEWTPHLQAGCALLRIDQVKRHKSDTAGNCRACRETTRRALSSKLQQMPKFARRAT